MAAPMLSQKDVSKAVKKVKKPVAKSVLCNPFETKWPLVEDEVRESITARIKVTFDSLKLAIPKISKKKRQNMADGKEDIKSSRQLTEKETQLRSQLAIGINEVTRGLEKRQLRLVLADRNCRPALLTQHLIALSASQQCPAVCVPALCGIVGKALGLKSLVALGFKNISTGDLPHFSELVTFVSEKVPCIKLPWKDKLCEAPLNADSNTTQTSVVESDRTQSDVGEGSDKLPSKKSNHEGLPGSKSFIKFPIVSNQKTENSVDYSYLYIYKSDPRARKKCTTNFGADFLALSKDSDEESEIYEVVTQLPKDDNTPKGKKRKGKTEHGRKRLNKKKKLDSGTNILNYKMAKLGKLQANLKRTKKKLKP